MSKALGRRLSADQIAYQQTLQGLKDYQVSLGLTGDDPTGRLTIVKGTQEYGRPPDATLPFYEVQDDAIDQVSSLETQFNIRSLVGPLPSRVRYDLKHKK